MKGVLRINEMDELFEDRKEVKALENLVRFFYHILISNFESFIQFF
jgi:hypothetical protein